MSFIVWKRCSLSLISEWWETIQECTGKSRKSERFCENIPGGGGWAESTERWGRNSGYNEGNWTQQIFMISVMKRHTDRHTNQKTAKSASENYQTNSHYKGLGFFCRQTHITNFTYTHHNYTQIPATNTQILGVLAWWQQGVSQKCWRHQLVQSPVWMWARWESSSESSRCSPPLRRQDLQSESLSLYSLDEVNVAQIQIWGLMTSHSRSSSCCASITSNQNSANSNYNVFERTSPFTEVLPTTNFLHLLFSPSLHFKKNQTLFAIFNWMNTHVSFCLLWHRLLEHYQVSVTAEGSHWAVKNTRSHTCSARWVTAAPRPHK